MRKLIVQAIVIFRPLVFAAATLGLSSAAAIAQIEFVYQVKATHCASLPVVRIQTGFRLQGVRGIVTALHGVAGCKHITASRPGTDETQLGLEDVRIDIDRDVALLQGGSLTGSSTGLEPHPTGVPSERKLQVVGLPSLVQDVLHTELTLETMRLVSLDWVPLDMWDAFRLRGSPQTWVRVLRVNGNLQPGHSGAPIIDSTGRVVGIGSGGLASGTVGIGWAIPITPIDWMAKTDPRVSARYDKIKRMAPTAVFAVADEVFADLTPRIRVRGSGCLRDRMIVDLDRGEISPQNADGDLALFNSFLQPGVSNTAQIALMGEMDFDVVSASALRAANPTNTTLDATLGSHNEIKNGSVVAIRTSNSRFAKVRIVENRGDIIKFDWVTYALPSEGPLQSQPLEIFCGPERFYYCGTGQLPGDSIDHVNVVGERSSDLVVSVQHRVNPAHGPIVIWASLLDEDGGYVSPSIKPMLASRTGKTEIEVPLGPGKARYLFVLLQEQNKGEGFVCKRFDYRRW